MSIKTSVKNFYLKPVSIIYQEKKYSSLFLRYAVKCLKLGLVFLIFFVIQKKREEKCRKKRVNAAVAVHTALWMKSYIAKRKKKT